LRARQETQARCARFRLAGFGGLVVIAAREKAEDQALLGQIELELGRRGSRRRDNCRCQLYDKTRVHAMSQHFGISEQKK